MAKTKKKQPTHTQQKLILYDSSWKNVEQT